MYLSIYLFIYLSIHASIHLSMYLPNYLFIYLSIYPCIVSSIHVFIHLSIHLSIYLSNPPVVMTSLASSYVLSSLHLPQYTYKHTTYKQAGTRRRHYMLPIVFQPTNRSDQLLSK